MSGIAHYLEDEGIATVIIALVREHAEAVQPPRALWVPYMLGRPFGEPNNPDLQTTIIRQALALLDEEEGPVLIDADVPEPDDLSDGNWVCPVSFPQSNPTSLGQQIAAEIAQLRSWYELGIEQRGGTRVGLSPDSIEEAAAALVEFAESTNPEIGLPDPNAAEASLRWWSSDLKAFYFEAIMTQPGDPTAEELERWFCNDTATGKLFAHLRQLCLNHTDAQIREIGLYMIGNIESKYYVELYAGTHDQM